ncbi:MAG: hypothetical protein CO137_03420 [Candidatus Magasanikbacteria bacterium CG_4_9_14_3_um_filter_32_9]|uniref:DUF3048 domain-containing protein n=1 Tax=Candidatus Magasanikbacteria bacterium CG_4_9_14_3_um_filter_32_9 TaxID=1974644 RepID=A0A2M7Z649_9BACT|nr:MAG: hypothetical protein CO137_03420 [Candidatus Magasanikbacteria bacterium CG_4_9_14_3_um_filter_32_9]
MKEINKGKIKTELKKIKKFKIKKGGLDEVAYVYFLAIIGFLIGFVLLVWIGLGYIAQNYGEKDNFVDNFIGEQIVEKDVECKKRRVLDGVCIEENEESMVQVVGVMIDNHPDARPQSGISKASIVYEASVEGGYTRYFALFPAFSNVSKVGPVRSVRPYFLDWSAEYGSMLYMHVGGSPDALDLIKSRNIFDLNEFFGDWYFWRTASRLAPHNTYTSAELWNNYLEDKEVSIVDEYKGWKFTKVEECEENCVENINIPFLYPSFIVDWKYLDGKYERYQAGIKDRDLEGGAFIADTIIVQKAKNEVIDDKGRRKIYTISEGEAIVFQKGNMIKGTWQKESLTGRTRFFDENGKEMGLNAGKIWVEVVPDTVEIVWK